MLNQLKSSAAAISIEILPMTKLAQTPTDAVPKFLDIYRALSRVGHLAKESLTGKADRQMENRVGRCQRETGTCRPIYSYYGLEETVKLCAYLIRCVFNCPDSNSDRRHLTNT